MLDAHGGWTRLDAEGDVHATGRPVGGCLEIVSHLAGTPYGDLEAFVDVHAPEGTIVYLEAAAADAADVTRRLLGLRYAEWFAHANAVLIGRTHGPDAPGWTQHDAVRHARWATSACRCSRTSTAGTCRRTCRWSTGRPRVEHTAAGSVLTQHLA